MKNVLKKFEENEEAQFFVMKSYLMTTFDFERKKPIYHIYYIKKNSNPEAYQEGYRDLKVRKMNRKEIEYFLGNIKKYIDVLTNDAGVIYNLGGRPFDKSQCKKHKQFMLDLYDSNSES